MATYYVWDGGSNGDGLSWANAKTTLQAALTIASSGSDIILIDKDHTGDNAQATASIYTAANHVSVICVDKDNSDALATMGTANWIGSGTATINISFAGAYRVYFYGITVRNAGSTNTRYINLAGDDLMHVVYDNCYLWHGSSGTSAGGFQAGAGDDRVVVDCINCTFRFGSTGQRIYFAGKLNLTNCQISSDGSAPTTLFLNNIADPGGAAVYAEGCDFSHCGSNTLFGVSTTAATTSWLANCKLGSGFVMNGSMTSAAQHEAYLFNCFSGDEHYHFGHYNAYGQTTAWTGIYANDNPTYDGTNKCSWKIVTSAYATFYTPYISPWIDKYHSGTSSITPWLEICRSGSSAAYDNDEVWADFSFQATASSTRSTLKNDRMAVLGTPAAQTTSSKTVSDWTGEDAGSWFGKLEAPSATTPAEIGHLRARVCVGIETTLYLDPQIRT